jgi:CRISPR-associated endonuclease Cas1
MRAQRSIQAEQSAKKQPPLIRRASRQTASRESSVASQRGVSASAPRTHRSHVAPPVKLEPIKVNDGVVSLWGYGVRIAVEKGHLVLADGAGTQRRAGRFARATCGIKRVVVHGSAFFITGDAIIFLSDIGAAFLNLGYDGEILAHWTPAGHDDARLRRAQALAPWTDTGMTLTKYLLREKILGQAHVIERYIPHVTEALAVIRGCLPALDETNDPHAIRKVEADAAAAYWSAWETIPVQFARKDAARVPEHWTRFGARVSPVTGRPQGAANPANALLNYLYAILEAETRTACIAAGLDPGLGLFHTDTVRRDSLVLDLMEPVRPTVDAWLLDTLAHRTWAWDDFGEVRSGVCRVLPPLTHALAETALAWYRPVGLYVEHVAKTLFTSADAVILPSGFPRRQPPASQTRDWEHYPTRLTRTNSRVSRQALHPNKAPRRDPSMPKLPNACRGCGVVLDDAERMYCDDCLRDVDAERKRRFIAAGTAKIEALKAAGTDPRGTPAVRQRISALHRARAEWEARHGSADSVDTGFFTDIIRPKLQDVGPAAVARATGMSAEHCWKVLNRGLIPHPMHWTALAALVGVDWQPAPVAYPPESDPERYRRVILPRLQGVILRDIAAITGTSLNACMHIRKGRTIPHPDLWPALAALAGVPWPSEQ